MVLASHRLKEGDQVYKMSFDTLEVIIETLREWWDKILIIILI
jgi:hypothetical protein